MGFSDWWQSTVNDTLMGRKPPGQVIDDTIKGVQDWGQEHVNEPIKDAIKGVQDWGQEHVNEPLKQAGQTINNAAKSAALPLSLVAGVLLLILLRR